MIALADCLVPGEIRRVLMHTVVVVPTDWQPDRNTEPTERT